MMAWRELSVEKVFVSTIFPLHHMQNGYGALQSGMGTGMGTPCEVYPFRTVCGAALMVTCLTRGSGRRTCLCGNSRLFLHFVELNSLKCMKCTRLGYGDAMESRILRIFFSFFFLSLSSRIQEIV